MTRKENSVYPWGTWIYVNTYLQNSSRHTPTDSKRASDSGRYMEGLFFNLTLFLHSLVRLYTRMMDISNQDFKQETLL